MSSNEEVILRPSEHTLDGDRKVTKYKCTCNGNVKALRHLHYMSETEVDEEGICVYCGHYAFKLTGNSANASRGKRKRKRGEESKDQRTRKMVNGKQVAVARVYVEEVNIKEHGTSGGGSVILSGWKEISRF